MAPAVTSVVFRLKSTWAVSDQSGDILIEPPVSAFPKPTRKAGALRSPVIPYPAQGEGELLVLPKLATLIIWEVLPSGFAKKITSQNYRSDLGQLWSI